MVQMHIACLTQFPGTWKWNIKLSMIHRRFVGNPFAMIPSVAATGKEKQNFIERRMLTCKACHGLGLRQRCKTSTANFTRTMDFLSGFEDELQDLFEEVKTLADEGKKNDATILLRANYVCVSERVLTGSKSMAEAATLCVVALGYMAVKNLKLVKPVLAQLSEVVIGLKDLEPRLNSILEHMGVMFAALGQSEDSIIIYRRAFRIARRIYGKNSMFLLSPLLGMAKALGSKGRVIKATEYFNRAIAIVELNEGSDSVSLIEPLLGLGDLLVPDGKTNEAENLFTRVVSICTKAYGENDGRTGMAICHLAPVKFAKGNVDEAIQSYRDALQMIEQSGYVDLDEKFLERTRLELAELLLVVGRQSEGREVLEESLRIVDKHKGKDHPDSVIHLINLANAYAESGNYAASEPLLRRSLQIAVENSGPDNDAVTRPMLHLAIALYHLERYTEAESLALEALRIRRNTYGEDSAPAGEALDCLVSVQIRLERDPGELIILAEDVLRIQERAFGHMAEELIRTLHKLAYLLEKTGRVEEKERVDARLSEITQIYSPTD